MQCHLVCDKVKNSLRRSARDGTINIVKYVRRDITSVWLGLNFREAEKKATNIGKAIVLEFIVCCVWWGWWWEEKEEEEEDDENGEIFLSKV